MSEIENAFEDMRSTARDKKKKFTSFIGKDGRIINFVLIMVCILFLCLAAFSFVYFYVFYDAYWLARGFFYSAMAVVLPVKKGRFIKYGLQ